MKTSPIRRFSLLMAVCLLFTLLAPSASAFNHYPYWALQAAYGNAVSSGDDDALLRACEGIVSLYADFPDADASYRVEVPSLQAAAVYEKRGQYRDALRMYEAYKACLEVRNRFVNEDVSERLLYAEAFLDAYAYTEPTVYAHASRAADVPYYGAKHEPQAGTYAGMCSYAGAPYDTSLSNGYLLYATFESESFQSFEWVLPKTDASYLLEAAWNLPHAYTEQGAIEYLNRIAGGSLDSYIRGDLQYLNGLRQCKVLLRFAAEVNVWGVNNLYKASGQLEEFKTAYIKAFRHIHDLAETYAPNVAMVYSPNDISNLYVTHNDFYPGDDYVDWVGFSSYGNLSDEATGQHADMNDTYYKRGLYENQLVKIMDIVRAYGDRKPILVSECGFMYRSDSSRQTEEHAKRALETFYAYINMLYPQVKAVFYFNADAGGECFSLHSNRAMASAYAEAVRSNRVMADTLAGRSSGYTRLETLNEVRSDLTLSVYAAYPGSPSLQVEYLVDGQRASLTDRIPYTCTIPASMLGAGSHSLKVITRAGESEYTKSFTLHVQSDGTVSAEAILHEGGRATCSAKAVCTVCGQPYGEIDPNAHAVSSVWSFSDGRHYHICENGCGTLFDAVACSGGAADCVNKAVCAVCGHPYGSLSEHQPQNRFTTLDGRHARRCQTAGCTAVFDEGACADSDSDRICDICFGAMPIKAPETTAVSETAATAESTTASTEATASPESNASSSQAEASVSLPSPDSSDSPQATAAPAEPKSTSPAFESEPESEEELTDSSPSNGTLLPLVGLAALSLIVVAVVLWRLVRKW